MLTAIAITPDASVGEGIRRLAIASRQVSVQKTFEHYVSAYELLRACNACDPDLVFVDLADWEAASPIVAKLHEEFPQTAILGISAARMRSRVSVYREQGVCQVLFTPLDLPAFQEGVLHGFRSTRSDVLDNLVAFLPAKAGNGCSLTAFNVAGALAGEPKRRTLLIEGDLHSGILCIRARFATERSLEHVLEDPNVLTHAEWPEYVVARLGFDILPAGRSRIQFQPRWTNYYHLLQFADREYDTVIADLPETVNDATAEVVLRAATVYIVSTAEKPSLDLACRRCEELDELGVAEERVQVVVNRWHPTDMTPDELERLLGRKVAKALPNDYQSVRSATDEGRLVAPAQPLGEAYLRLARQIAGLVDEPEAEAEPAEKPRFRLATFLGR